jgi:Predicted endonuclease containing a URI domain
MWQDYIIFAKVRLNMNYVYIVECSDGTFYTGWTNNLQKRIDMHSKGIGAKYTRGRGPVKLVYHEMFELKEDAMKREYQIKRLTRQEKLLLINVDNVQ